MIQNSIPMQSFNVCVSTYKHKIVIKELRCSL